MVFKDLVPSDRIKKAEDLKGAGTTSGTVKENEFGRRVSMSAALRHDDSLADLQGNQGGGTARGGMLKTMLGTVKKKGGAEDKGDNLGMLKEIEKQMDTARPRQGGTDKRAMQSVNMLKSVQGLVVDWPLEFMGEEFENLHPSALPGEIFK